MRSITSLYGAVNIWIASLEILTKILRRILNYLLVMGYLTLKFARFLQKDHLSFKNFEGNSLENC